MQKKILIIDDDIDLVEAMRLTLENAGFEVIDAQDGQKGLEKID
jgi:DNA-binding response OmpR family regulator